MRDTSFDQNLFHKKLRESSNALFWLGVTMALVGVAAIVFPMISTLAAAILVAI